MRTGIVIGLIVGVAVGAVALIKSKEKKYAEVQSPETDEEEKKEESSEVKEKIRKTAVKVVNWILTHKDDIEAATLVLGLMSAVINFKNKVNEGRKAVIKKPTKKDPFLKDISTLDGVLNDMIENKITVGHCEDESRGVKFDIVMKGEAA